MWTRPKKKHHPLLVLTLGTVTVLSVCHAVSAMRDAVCQGACCVKQLLHKAPRAESSTGHTG